MNPIRLFLILPLLLLLGACGFTPLYGDHGVTGNSTVQETFAKIAITNIPNRDGQYLRNQLIDRFYIGGIPQNPAYDITVSALDEHKLDLATTKSANVTRAELTLRANFRLTERATGKTLISRRLSTITSYNILTSQFTTRVSEDNARQNALDDLARQIEQQVALYFERQ